MVLSLINRNTARGGNDFAIDEVYLGTTSIVNPPPIPEPQTYAMLLAGLAALAGARQLSFRRRARQS